MGCFEDSMARDVVNIAARRNPDSPYLGGKRITEIVTIEIQSGDDIEIFRPGENLLQGDVRNGVLDYDSRAWFSRRNLAPGPSVNFLRPEIILRHLIAPVTERALSKLHDVPFVHERHTFPLVKDRIGDRAVDQSYAS